MRKNYFLVVDTETTQDSKVADFAAVVCDRQGNILTSCAVLVDGIYTDSTNHPLFYTSDRDGIWSKQGQDKRYQVYNDMLQNGDRMLASVNAINVWLKKVNKQCSPILTAYNLPFDMAKCKNTNIDLSIFDKSFCIFNASYEHIAKRKDYKKFILKHHLFNSATDKGNMTYKCTAESVSSFIDGNLLIEPHQALEDVVEHEIPILKYLLKRVSVNKLINSNVKYSWQGMQVNDNFSV